MALYAALALWYVWMTPLGECTLYLGMYTWPDWVRRPVTGMDGAPADHGVVGRVSVP